MNYTGGTIEGAGKDLTIIEAAQDFKALPNEFIGGETASMLELNNTSGDITIKDMTFRVKGADPAQGHNNPFTGYSTNIDNIIVGHGAGISLECDNLRIEGDSIGSFEGAYNGYNITYPLIATAMNNSIPVNFTVKYCDIEGGGDNVMEYFETYGGIGTLTNNNFSNCYSGIWLGWGTPPCKVTVMDNDFVNIKSKVIDRNSRIVNYCFQNNTQDGVPMTDDCKTNQ